MPESYPQHSNAGEETQSEMNIIVFSVSASLLGSNLKKSGWKLSSIPYLPRRDLPSDIEKACPGPWGAHYQVTNENETFVLRGTSQAHSRARCYRLTLKTAHPLIDWREAGWELTLALNGLKYACATVFFRCEAKWYPPLFMIYQAHSEPSRRG